MRLCIGADDWRRYFEEIKIAFLEDVVARPDETLEEIGRFIGLSAWPKGIAGAPINSSDAIHMPAQDRVFLFGLHQATYDAAEVSLGGPALGWGNGSWN